METIYFNFICQKSTDGKMMLMAVVPDDIFGHVESNVFEVQSFKMPATIYTGTYPQIKVNTSTIKDRSDLKGLGANGIFTSPIWYNQKDKKDDVLGISID